jgi:hypothetical protein
MQYTLSISLQAERVATQLLQSSAGGRALRFLRGGAGSAGDAVACDVQSLSCDGADLVPALERSIASIAHSASKPVDGWDLEVKLGLAFARLAVLPLEGVSPSATILSGVARAWVAERLHLDPAAQELRWRMMDDHHLLVYCAPKSVLAMFNDLARRRNLRLSSFLPAALEELLRRTRQRPQRGQPASRVLVWTESAEAHGRIAPVHLFHLRRRQLCTDWRGWLPPPAANEGGDAALAGAVTRFLAANGAVSATVEHAHWPLVPALEATP